MPAPTIKDVARASGVSTTTVSFVLNGTGSVGAEVRERVLRVARELGYTPDPLARAMITRRTRSLGVLVNNVDTFTSSTMVSGIEAAARAGGYEILLALHRNEPETAGSAMRDLAGRRVDAVIAVFSKTERHPGADEALTRSGVPYVLAYYHASADAEIDNVSVDQEQGGHLATSRLLDIGRRRIAFVGGPEGRNATLQRLTGYRRALAERGLEPHPAHTLFGTFSVATGLEAAEQLIGHSDVPEPDAIFAGDDEIGAGLLRALRRHGKRVPEDIAVVGFNDAPVAEAVDPPLTSIHMPLEEVGRLCVERAIARLDHPDNWKPSSLMLPCTLTLRESA